MENWQVALVILVSLFVGMLVPLLIQFVFLLRSLREQMKRTGQLVDQTLMNLSQTTAHVSKFTQALEGGGEPVAKLLAAVGELSQSVQQVNRSMRLASAVAAAAGPAIAAFVQSMRGDGSAPGSRSGNGAGTAQAEGHHGV